LIDEAFEITYRLTQRDRVKPESAQTRIGE
jgi:hypothetical protein